MRTKLPYSCNREKKSQIRGKSVMVKLYKLIQPSIHQLHNHITVNLDYESCLFIATSPQTLNVARRFSYRSIITFANLSLMSHQEEFLNQDFSYIIVCARNVLTRTDRRRVACNKTHDNDLETMWRNDKHYMLLAFRLLLPRR
jgi:hypothetical protein